VKVRKGAEEEKGVGGGECLEQGGGDRDVQRARTDMDSGKGIIQGRADRGSGGERDDPSGNAGEDKGGGVGRGKELDDSVERGVARGTDKVALSAFGERGGDFEKAFAKAKVATEVGIRRRTKLGGGKRRGELGVDGQREGPEVALVVSMEGGGDTQKDTPGFLHEGVAAVEEEGGKGGIVAGGGRAGGGGE